jgi:hypothetical protein
MWTTLVAVGREARVQLFGVALSREQARAGRASHIRPTQISSFVLESVEQRVVGLPEASDAPVYEPAEKDVFDSTPASRAARIVLCARSRSRSIVRAGMAWSRAAVKVSSGIVS